MLFGADGRIEAVVRTGGGNADAYVDVDVDGVLDVGELVVSPGIVDCHVHINEPGRTDWEGFTTATRAAAAGGVTTLVDMPLNCLPVTTTRAALETKLAATAGQLCVDVGFWGGVIPGNARDLAGLARAGALGCKAFLVHSGIDEFPNATEADLRQAMPVLRALGLPLLAHAELDLGGVTPEVARAGDPRAYRAYLASRPPAWEDQAIRLLVALCRETGCAVHVVHLSSASSLPTLRAAKAEGLPITVETCPHYLCLEAETIPDGATHFKCAPPIREHANREALWGALADGTIDLVISDHSPCTPALKLPERGDFQNAWGGIASLQLGLPAVWTEARRRGHGLHELATWMSARPAALAGLGARKGADRRRARRRSGGVGSRRGAGRRGRAAGVSPQDLALPRRAPVGARAHDGAARRDRLRRRRFAAGDAGRDPARPQRRDADRGRGPNRARRAPIMSEPVAVGFTGLVDLAAAALGGRALGASDEFFAGAENLVQPGRGVFIEGRFTDRGKWMDGWESRRRRAPRPAALNGDDDAGADCDWCVLRLGAPGEVVGFDVDTNHFVGNHPPFASIEGLPSESSSGGGPSLSEPRSTRSSRAATGSICCRNRRCARARRTCSRRSRARRSATCASASFPTAASPACGCSVGSRRSGSRRAPAAMATCRRRCRRCHPRRSIWPPCANGGLALACSDAFFGPMNNLLLPGRADRHGRRLGDASPARPGVRLDPDQAGRARAPSTSSRSTPTTSRGTSPIAARSRRSHARRRRRRASPISSPAPPGRRSFPRRSCARTSATSSRAASFAASDARAVQHLSRRRRQPAAPVGPAPWLMRRTGSRRR